MLPDDPTDSVVLATSIGTAWIEYKRFEWLDQALNAMGSLLDKRRNEIPTDVLGQPSPTFVIPRDRSLELLYRTTAGVQNAVELSDHPGELIHQQSVWPQFRSATRELLTGLHTSREVHLNLLHCTVTSCTAVDYD